MKPPARYPALRVPSGLLGPVLFLAWGRPGGVEGAVQEHRGDECGGFLDAGLVLGGHAGCGLEEAAEQ